MRNPPGYIPGAARFRPPVLNVGDGSPVPPHRTPRTPKNMVGCGLASTTSPDHNVGDGFPVPLHRQPESLQNIVGWGLDPTVILIARTAIQRRPPPDHHVIASQCAHWRGNLHLSSENGFFDSLRSLRMTKGGTLLGTASECQKSRFTEEKGFSSRRSWQKSALRNRFLTDVVCSIMFCFLPHFRRIRNIFHHIRHQCAHW